VTLALLLACAGDGDGKDGAGAGDDTAPETLPEGYVSGQSPKVEAVTGSECAPNTMDVEMWSLEATVSDPQGVEDIDTVTVAVVEGDAEVASYRLACNEGACSGFWLATDDDVSCARGAAAIFRLQATDVEGHVSLPFDYDPP
jgi:hypothetical protein